MSGKVRLRTTANSAESATLTVNEKILKECHSLYTDPDHGLVSIAQELGENLLAPRKKITVLLIGNHSAGKSTFINWYIEEHVQKTGVAIETQGFAFVTSGRKRESLSGNATLHLYEHFQPLRELEGVVDYLTTEISASKQKRFSLVTFIDTPGLVDGDMQYQFDVNKAILWLGDMADLIFVFFDPIGQALCKRTLTLAEQLNNKHPDRIRFYLSKADEAGMESDRQRVMMQIVQELCKRPGLNKTAFDMPTIYIPALNKQSRCVNQIEEVCREIDKTIEHTIQKTLNKLEEDCDRISLLVDERLKIDGDACLVNRHTRCRSWCYCLVGLLIPVLALLAFLATPVYLNLQTFIGSRATDALVLYMAPLHGLWRLIPEEYHQLLLLAFTVTAAVFIILSRFHASRVTTLSRKQRRSLRENAQYVQKYVKEKKQSLYHEYLQQSIGDHDL